VELRVDLGVVGDRTFVNNASFGAYAELVQSPEYRGDKTGSTLALLPQVLLGPGRARLVARAAGWTVDGPQALLVSNNPYETTDVVGMGRRVRLDGGALGVLAVRVDSALQAAELVRGKRSRGVTMTTTTDLLVDADVPWIPVGVDGEAVWMPTPVYCAVRAGGLRVRVPRDRPGALTPRPAMDWHRLWRQAVDGWPGRGPGRPAPRG
jgi:diacylglycerol kinase family enzyme